MANLVEKAKIAAMSVSLTKAWQYLDKDPENNIPKLMDMVDKVAPEGWYESQREAFRKAIADKTNWYELMMKVWNLDPGVRNAFFKNFIVNASLSGSARQEEVKAQEGCNVPWVILLDPTSACNMHCTGCWAAEYGNRLNLTFEELDSIVTQGKELGTYMYIFTGGEPLVRKKDVIALCEKHSDCEFLSFTNGTLIDEAFCQDVTSEEFFDMIIDAGALFVWFFHYMPVGSGAAPQLLPSPEQREKVYRKIREYRSTKSIFSMDFQNDAEYVGGCIAGGRRYLHINAKGDVEPCVFIHYSNANIRECSLLDALKSPIFMAYHDGQPFNKNMLRPCPMLENPEKLRAMVKETHAVSTDYESPESVDTLCDRCRPYAENWKPEADRLWEQCGK